MQETILGLINQLIPDILGLVAVVVIFYVQKLLKYWLPKIEAWIDAHTTATQRETIRELGHEAFAYAETVFRDKNGADKLHEALAYFQAHMSKYGLSNLSYEVIRAAIERAWLMDKSMRSTDIVVTAEPAAAAPDQQSATPDPAVMEVDSQTS